MGEKVKVPVPDINGNITEAIGLNMEIISMKEPWSEYILENGTKIRARQAVISIVKLDQKNVDGSDAYMLQSQSMLHVIPELV